MRVKEYHKIDTLFKRDMDSPKKTLIIGHWTCPEFDYLASNPWEFTEKVDGMNIRVMIADGAINFGGKTDNASIPAPLVRRLQERFLPEKEALLEQFPDGACFYGEGYGAKIQKGGGNYRQDQDFVLFDILIGESWLNRDAVVGIGALFDLSVVPVIGNGPLNTAVQMAQCGFESMWGSFQAEGIVARPKIGLLMRDGSRIITKIKCRDFE